MPHKQQLMRSGDTAQGAEHTAYECCNKLQSNRGKSSTALAIRTERLGRLPASSAHPSHTPGLPGSSVGCPAPRCWWCKDQTEPQRDVWCQPRTSLGKMQAEVRHINRYRVSPGTKELLFLLCQVYLDSKYCKNTKAGSQGQPLMCLPNKNSCILLWYESYMSSRCLLWVLDLWPCSSLVCCCLFNHLCFACKGQYLNFSLASEKLSEMK